jgi:hypothetical protein
MLDGIIPIPKTETEVDDDEPTIPRRVGMRRPVEMAAAAS